MFKSLEAIIRYLIVIGIAAMLSGLFFSRALLSIGMVVLVTGVIMLPPVKGRWRQLLSDPLNIGFCFLFLIPLLSGLWSSDVSEWWLVKLPLVILCFAFGLLYVSPNQARGLEGLYILLLLAGSVWSMYYYTLDTDAMHQAYHRAGVIPTWFENDHVRFSWAIVIGVLLLTRWLLYHWQQGKIWMKITVCFMLVWLIVFLHILSAKTGLLCLYLSLFILAAFLLLQRQKRIWAFSLLVLLLLLPVIAYYILPTFQTRVHYVLYDYQQYITGSYKEGFPDGDRVLSLKAGKDIFSANAAYGVGFGDVWGITNAWYDEYYPHIRMPDRLFPGGEWMMYATGAGLLGLLVFVTAMLLPFFNRHMQKDPTWWCLNATACFIFLYEVNLESQFGVFLYCFFILWWRKTAKDSIPYNRPYQVNQQQI
jgi:O-antigen ligase